MKLEKAFIPLGTNLGLGKKSGQWMMFAFKVGLRSSARAQKFAENNLCVCASICISMYSALCASFRLYMHRQLGTLINTLYLRHAFSALSLVTYTDSSLFGAFLPLSPFLILPWNARCSFKRRLAMLNSVAALLSGLPLPLI